MKHRVGILMLTLLGAAGANADVRTSPPAAGGAAFDPEAATEAYLAKVTPEKKARSDAYFEGGYWLRLWDFLAVAAVSLLLLASRTSARMRDLASRLTRRAPLATFLYFLQYVVLMAVLLFPLTVYEGFVREHRYGLATQTLGPWLGDRVKELGVAVVLGGLFVTALYGILRKAGRRWWIWGSAAAVLFLAFASLIAPVLIFPLFNRYRRLEDPKIRGPILAMARANGISTRDVWVMDASRQTTRVSANVSGLFGTERITLNDNLLRRCTLPEIEAVMGHEIGHYVLNHLAKGMVFGGISIVIGFAFVRALFERAQRRWGARWDVSGVGDVAGLPLLVLLASLYSFLLTPVSNTIVRVQETEADLFGLNVSRQPDGEAEVALKLGEYRKLDPGPLEELVFFDHPSGRARILAAMRWKAEQRR